MLTTFSRKDNPSIRTKKRLLTSDLYQRREKFGISGLPERVSILESGSCQQKFWLFCVLSVDNVAKVNNLTQSIKIVRQIRCVMLKVVKMKKISKVRFDFQSWKNFNFGFYQTDWKNISESSGVKKKWRERRPRFLVTKILDKVINKSNRFAWFYLDF